MERKKVSKKENFDYSVKNMMSYLFELGISEEAKEVYYQKNQKVIKSALKEEKYSCVSLFLNSYDRVPVSILRDLLRSLNDEELFRIIVQSKSEKLVQEAYFSNQKAFVRELKKKLEEEDFDYLCIMDSSYPIEMIDDIIFSLNESQAFQALIFHTSSNEVYRLRKKEMDKILEKKIHDQNFFYPAIFFPIYYGDNPIPKEFIEKAIFLLDGEQAFQILTDYRVNDKEIKEKIFSLKKKEVTLFVKEKLQDQNFDSVRIFLGNSEKLPIDFVESILHDLDFRQSLNLIFKYTDYNDTADKIRNQLYFSHQQEIDQFLQEESQKQNFDYSSFFDYKRTLPKELVQNFVSSLSLNQIFMIVLSNIRMKTKKAILEVHQEEINQELQSVFGKNIDYQVLLSKKISLKVFDFLLDHLDSSSVFLMMDDKLRKDEEYVKHVYAKMYHLDLRDKKVEKMFLMLPFFRGKAENFISSFQDVEDFVSYLGISSQSFWQYSLSNNPKYFSNIIGIIQRNDMENFKRVKDYFFQNLYPSSDEGNVQIGNFLDLLENYTVYRDFCISVSLLQRELTLEEKNKVLFLFQRKEKEMFKGKVSSLEDCDKVYSFLKEEFKAKLFGEEKLDKEELKNIICQMLFNDSLISLKQQLFIYGDTEELRKLQFNDREYPELVEDIEFMMIYTSMIETIIHLNDKKSLQQLAMRIFQYIDIIFTSSFQLQSFVQKMRDLYALESEMMLSKVLPESSAYSKILDKEKSSLYGVETLDFSDKEYLLYAHVLGDNEEIDEVVQGVASGEKNFICLTPISYRNQVYYFEKTDQIIFGYDNVSSNHFIMSSPSNMNSNRNGSIQKNSNEIHDFVRKQRGILETSEAKEGNNAEALCFREGLKPSYIILPGGRAPNDLEIRIAKQYHLKFAVTQKPNTRISSPIKISSLEENSEVDKRQQIEDLQALKNQLFQYQSRKKLKKIAIFSDSHGMFEPALAILSDAKKNGVDEIYSLGDNIGTGPNPREVLALLDQYQVKSVMGNHEMYITKGVDFLKQHLEETYSYDEALRNSTWTREKLTTNQVENLELYPLTREVALGKKKILLCHSSKDLNHHRLIVDPKNYDTIFQGHVHFQNKKGNIQTLRGAGIGAKKKNEQGKAYYVILSEQRDGQYKITEKLVPYDVSNLENDINLSDLSLEDKNKISHWVVGR